MSYEISLENDILLVNCTCEATSHSSLMADVFKEVSGRGINLDMISLTPPQGGDVLFSFTAENDDMTKILSGVARVKESHPSLRVMVSQDYCKLSVMGEQMRTTPGVAYRAIEAVAKIAQIGLVTTSEISISFLVPQEESEKTHKALLAVFK